jgi:hypothetical protein
MVLFAKDTIFLLYLRKIIIYHEKAIHNSLPLFRHHAAHGTNHIPHGQRWEYGVLVLYPNAKWHGSLDITRRKSKPHHSGSSREKSGEPTMESSIRHWRQIPIHQPWGASDVLQWRQVQDLCLTYRWLFGIQDRTDIA